MRDLGASTEAHFVEAPSAQKQKGKGKQKLEDALRDVSIEDEPKLAQPLLLDEDILPSRNLRKATYQDQQDVPDVLAGFQPDMDPRLREALEALEDEAYVDDDEEVFGELVKDGVEVPLEEFIEEGAWEGEDDAGWKTDDTAKPEEYKKVTFSKETTEDMETAGSNPSQTNTDWMSEFKKYKKAEQTRQAHPPSNSDLQSSVATGTSLTNGRRKKRKGALTSSTGYSMTSSSLFRTEGLRDLDNRFEKVGIYLSILTSIS
jgi:protein LTV1